MTIAAAVSSSLFYLSLAFIAASCGYYVAVMIASMKFRSESEPTYDYSPPVTLLKPLHGVEVDLYECLASHCRQDYPQFEIVFGVGDASDPALSVVEKLRREFTQIPMQVLVVTESKHANPKMNNLEQMLKRASHEVVVINDADIHIAPDYLRKVVRPLADDKVGMVTCLYRGTSARGLGAILEAIGITAEFAGQVLLGRWVEGIHFALGATMATRKKQIAEIGGIGKWADYLADDYIVGNRIAAAGYRIHLSHEIVETTITQRTVFSLLHQQIRWARTVRISRPRGYPGLLLAYGVIIAALAWCAYPSSTAMTIALVSMLTVRMLATFISGIGVCRDPLIRQYFWMIPLRDLLGFSVWIASFFGNTVNWRGSRFRVERGGRISPV
jgi:ceramide glucosyltransferase